MFVGLDLGTSGVRALLIDASQRVIGAKEAAVDTARPHAGWSEQLQSDWIAATQAVFAELKADHPAEVAAIKGIGVSGHMHGANLLDDAGAPLRPCMMWNDTRSAAQAANLDATDQVRDLSGNIVFPGFTAPNVA